MTLFIFFLFTSQITSVTAASGVDIIVTATRLETPAEQTGSSATIISKEELSRRPGEKVADLLRTRTGLTVNRAGGPGSATSLSIRGANSEHTLVLIDGVKVNDPLSPTRSFDFGNLPIEGIERIEIIRGSESVLYGSDAIGGIVHIITKRGGRTPSRVLGFGYGTYRTFETWTSVKGGEAEADYALNAQLETSRGFSNTGRELTGAEADGRTSASFSGHAGFQAAEETPFTFDIRYSKARNDNDFSGGPGGDDPDFLSTEQTFSGRLQARATRSQDWEPLLGLSYLNMVRTADKTPNSSHPEAVHTRHDSARSKIDLQNNFFVGGAGTISLGIEAERETGLSREDLGTGLAEGLRQSSTTVGLFVQYQHLSPTFFYTAGVRRDVHDRFGPYATYRIAPGVALSHSMTLRSSYGTGFKAPSLYQLYSAFGDPALRPELSTTFDLGLEQRFADGAALVRMSYFKTKLNDLIVFENSKPGYQNVGKSESQGLETEISSDLLSTLRATLEYTVMRAMDENSGLELLRRPRHQAAFTLSSHLGRAWSFDTAIRMISRRLDLDAQTWSRKSTPGYAVANLSLSYAVGVKSRLSSRIENIFDREYQEVDGYSTPGRTLFISFQQEF
ncbi:MAG: hypothetical protein A2603_13395 [Bdellovibrionales bacterium RIFOXYD1_FULL_55_31]|nr:MAG: hypothetical protein A2603_13395 [Bdellovibrionales bacterium RIFOXYD1_FULL_55_31]